MSQKAVKRQVKWLFVSPLIGFIHPQANELNSHLWQDGCALREEQKGMKRSNVYGWHSDIDLFQRPEPSFKALREWILQCSSEACNTVNENFLKTQQKAGIQAWININGKGAMNSPHTHPGCHWSGVYYVRVPDPEAMSQSGQIEFLDPRGGVAGANALPETDCFASKHPVIPRSGMLLIFPPYLVHWVYPNESSEERMSIAFNITYRVPLPSL